MFVKHCRTTTLLLFCYTYYHDIITIVRTRHDSIDGRSAVVAHTVAGEGAGGKNLQFMQTDILPSLNFSLSDNFHVVGKFS